MVPVQRPFQVVSPFKPTGDQPTAIEQLSRDILAGSECVTLLGATGTGKTFTMANVIERLQKPTLIISHNKTLAAQLYEEMRELFPNNSVNYFVSYYDYYQPEAYIPQRDIYIEKDSSQNEELDQLRLAATSNILSRRDTIVVASVSCIFGLGSPEAYGQRVLTITKGAVINRREFLLATGRDAVPAGRHRVRARPSSACAAMRSRSGPRTRSTRCASSSSATRSRRSSSSTRPAARCWPRRNSSSSSPPCTT